MAEMNLVVQPRDLYNRIQFWVILGLRALTTPGLLDPTERKSRGANSVLLRKLTICSRLGMAG